jgi:hypothetical protein
MFHFGMETSILESKFGVGEASVDYTVYRLSGSHKK